MAKATAFKAGRKSAAQSLGLLQASSKCDLMVWKMQSNPKPISPKPKMLMPISCAAPANHSEGCA